MVIKRNEIHSNTRDANTWSGKGIAIYTSRDMADGTLVQGGGDPLPHTNNILIEDNKIYDNKLYGIELNHSEAYHGGTAGPFDVDVRIINNEIYNNGGPLDALGGAYDYMRGISANGNEENVTVKGNEIYNHVSTTGARFSSANAAIRINNSTNWTIENNDIHGNTRGVYAYGTSSDITIKGDNTFSDNAQATVFKNEDTGEIKSGITFTDNTDDTWEDDGLLPGDIIYLDDLPT